MQKASLRRNGRSTISPCEMGQESSAGGEDSTWEDDVGGGHGDVIRCRGSVLVAANVEVEVARSVQIGRLAISDRLFIFLSFKKG
jgi:hypothetical protein